MGTRQWEIPVGRTALAVLALGLLGLGGCVKKHPPTTTATGGSQSLSSNAASLPADAEPIEGWSSAGASVEYVLPVDGHFKVAAAPPGSAGRLTSLSTSMMKAGDRVVIVANSERDGVSTSLIAIEKSFSFTGRAREQRLVLYPGSQLYFIPGPPR